MAHDIKQKHTRHDMHNTVAKNRIARELTLYTNRYLSGYLV